jgi:hypothetical protein
MFKSKKTSAVKSKEKLFGRSKSRRILPQNEKIEHFAAIRNTA